MNMSQSGANDSDLDAPNDFVAEYRVPKNQTFLTKALIKADNICMTSSHIVSLLESIWKYSSTHVFIPITAIELAAGHRYWLPDKLLAEEWMMVFLFAPTWLLESAPPEVKTAFEKQVYNVMGAWPSFAEILRKEDNIFMPLSWFPSTQLARQPLKNGSSSLYPQERIDLAMQSSPRSLVNQKIPYMTVPEHSSCTVDPETGCPQPKRARLGNKESNRLVIGPHLVPSSGIDPRLSLQPSAAPVSLSIQPSMSPTFVVPHTPVQPNLHAPQGRTQLPRVQPTQNIPQGHMQPGFASAPGPHPGLSSIPNVSVFPLQSVPSGAAAFVQNPAAPPIFDQLLQAQGITVPGFQPGAVIPHDNGKKAWSAERIRAFVQIQNKSIYQLPPTAFSPLGTEMSNFRTPESIDVTNCPFETSLEENFTYLSNVSTLNHEMCFRASRHWQPMHIARYINYAHDLQTPRIFGRSKIGHHFAKAAAWGKAHHGHVPTASLRNTSTDSGARGPNKVLHDYFLYSMGDGVVRPPLGRQAQMLTRVIDHVRNVTGDRNIRLSEAAAYAKAWNITVPAHEQMDFTNLADVDKLPSAAFLGIIKADYRNKFNGEDP